MAYRECMWDLLGSSSDHSCTWRDIVGKSVKWKKEINICVDDECDSPEMIDDNEIEKDSFDTQYTTHLSAFLIWLKGLKDTRTHLVNTFKVERPQN